MNKNVSFNISAEDIDRILVEEEDVKLDYEHSIWQDIKQGFKNKKIGIFCIIFLIIVIIGALGARFSPYDPNTIDASMKFQGISRVHFLGTDEYGRDYFTRILYGAQVSILIGIFSMTISILFGTFVGTVSGYLGGKTDTILMRLTEVFLALPAYLVSLLLSVMMKPSIFTLILVISLFAWPSVARITRAQTMTLKHRDFVVAAKNLGASDFYIIFKHIIPNMMGSITVAATLSIANAILAESFLSYLGLGIQTPRASWGSMLQNAQSYMLNAPSLAIIPGVMILLTVVSFNVLGDILQGAMEPKMNK